MSIQNTVKSFQTIPYEDRKKLFALLALILIAVAGAAFGTGAAVGHTKTVAKPIVHTVTKTVDVPTTPQACLDALDEADSGFNTAAQATGAFQDVISGIQTQDLSKIESATQTIKSTSSDLDTLSASYNADKEECRASK